MEIVGALNPKENVKEFVEEKLKRDVKKVMHVHTYFENNILIN